MPSTLALPEQRSPEFIPFRGEDSDDRPQNERMLDSAEAHPPQTTERNGLQQSQPHQVGVTTATAEGVEGVARSSEQVIAPIAPVGAWRRVGTEWVSPSGVFRLDDRMVNEMLLRNEHRAASTGAAETTTATQTEVPYQRVFIRPPTPPRAPSLPPASEPSPEVTRELYPFGTDWRAFFNWSDVAGNGDNGDDFEDSDDESSSDAEAVTVFMLTDDDDEWDESDYIDHTDGYLADSDEAGYFAMPEEEEADWSSEDEESNIRCWSPSVLSTISMSPPGSLVHTPRSSPSNTTIWTTPEREIAPYVAVVADAVNPPTYLDQMGDDIEPVNDGSVVHFPSGYNPQEAPADAQTKKKKESLIVVLCPH